MVEFLTAHNPEQNKVKEQRRDQNGERIERTYVRAYDHIYLTLLPVQGVSGVRSAAGQPWRQASVSVTSPSETKPNGDGGE
jgi:hypothetical protein